jgi:hypothetical protein
MNEIILKQAVQWLQEQWWYQTANKSQGSDYWFVRFRSFWCTDIKNNFFLKKKTSLTCILTQKVIWKAPATTLPNTLYIFHYSLSCSYKKIVIDYAIKKLPIFCSKITGPNILKKEEEETRIYIACLHLRFADGSSRLIFYGCRDTYLGTLLPFFFNKIHVVSSYLYLKIFLNSN